MSVVNGVVLDVDVLARTSLDSCCSCATLHADTVITGINDVVDDKHVLAAGDVDSVAILCIPWTFHSDAVDDNVLASGRDEVETGTVEQGNILDEYVLAIGESDHVVAYLFLCIDVIYYIRCMLQIERIPDVTLFVQDATHLLKAVPFHVAHLASLHRSPPFAIAVDGSFSGNGNVLSLAGIDGSSSAIFLLSCLLINFNQIVLIFREYDDGILLKMKVDVILQGNQPREIDAGRNIEVTAAHLAEFADSLAESLGVQGLSVAIATEVENAHLVVRNGWQSRLRHSHRQILIILAVIVGKSRSHGEECQ